MDDLKFIRSFLRVRMMHRIKRYLPHLYFLTVHEELYQIFKAHCRSWRPISATEFRTRMMATEWWKHG